MAAGTPRVVCSKAFDAKSEVTAEHFVQLRHGGNSMLVNLDWERQPLPSERLRMMASTARRCSEEFQAR